MKRSKIFGYIACIISLIAGIAFVYNAFFPVVFASNISIENLSDCTFYSITLSISLIALLFLGTGFWVGWTILTIKVVPPMPELKEKKDNSKIKAFFLCLLTLTLGLLFIYGIYIRSYWALAIPAAIASFIFLGIIFWVGIAIITTRTTLPKKNK